MGSNWAYSPPQPFAFSYEIASNSGPAGMPCTCCILARFSCRLCWEEVNVCARREQKPSLLGLCRAAANFRASECRAELVRAMPSAAENLKVNFRASECRAELFGLCRAQPNFRASECNRACSYCRAQPKISKPIFVQASAEPNDCVKPNEQKRVYSNFAMASNRTFKNLFGLCRAQPKITK